jgi:hypothetical protein
MNPGGFLEPGYYRMPAASATQNPASAPETEQQQDFDESGIAQRSRMERCA